MHTQGTSWPTKPTVHIRHNTRTIRPTRTDSERTSWGPTRESGASTTGRRPRRLARPERLGGERPRVITGVMGARTAVARLSESHYDPARRRNEVAAPECDLQQFPYGVRGVRGVGRGEGMRGGYDGRWKGHDDWRPGGAW